MWHRSILDTVRQGEQRGLCLYGAGFFGKIAYQIVERLGGHPLCFCDDDADKQGTTYQGLSVYSVEEAVKKYPDAVYLVCIDSMRKKGAINRDDLSAMLDKLKKYGVYDSNSELRLSLYLFLLDQPDVNEIVPCDDTQHIFMPEDLNQLLILNHMSNSGSFYLEQLLDGHPQILCLPYGTQVLRTVYAKRLQYLEGDELLLELEAQMLGYLHSQYETLDCVRRVKFHDYCMNREGNFNYDVLIEPQMFMKQLKTQFSEKRVKLESFGHMMKVLTAAYNNCLGKKKEQGQSYWLFYHMHQADYDVKNTYVDFQKNEFDRIENLIIIREPVQQCYSYIRRMVIQGRDTPVLTKDEDFIHTLKCELGMTLRRQRGIENVKVIRFEDLKYRSKNTLAALCEWMDIAYADSMSQTTLNGFDLVTFGSSFNVCNRQEALEEAKRILKTQGWFACMWNHRDLTDPLQKEIEDILKAEIDNYSYGTRREDQTEVINQSGLFGDVVYVEGTVIHDVLAEDFIEGWKSHGTVHRQSKDKFDLINAKIRQAVEAKGQEYIKIPYTTRIWMAQVK